MLRVRKSKAQADRKYLQWTIYRSLFDPLLTIPISVEFSVSQAASKNHYTPWRIQEVATLVHSIC